MVSEVMFVLAAIVNLITPHHRGVFDSFSDYLYQLLVVAAFALTLVAIAGLHALHGGNERYGRLRAAGVLMAFVGYALIAMVTAATMLVGAESLQGVRLVSAVAVLIGSILLGAMTIRAGSAVVVRRADNRRLPPRRYLERRG
jgi:small-conductance mechanosensitive channel